MTMKQQKSQTGEPAGKRLKVTLEKSLAGQLRHIASSARGLGLRRRHQTVLVADTPQNRGMIGVAAHMIKVETTG
jgi:large subunit ribosomal protein L30